MNNIFKIALIVLAPVTLALIIAAIVTLNAVSGYSLLYLDSGLGSFYVASYRWFCLFSVLLIIFWIVMAIKYRRNIVEQFKKIGAAFKSRLIPQTVPAAPKQSVPDAPAQSMPAAPAQASPVQSITPSTVQSAHTAPVQSTLNQFTPSQTAPATVKTASLPAANQASNVSSQAMPAAPVNILQNEVNTAPAAPDRAAFCRQCGKPVSTADKFCYFCGSPIAH